MNYLYFNKELYYPNQAPYDPDTLYPENPFEKTNINGSNCIYSAIRESFMQLGYDKQNIGKKEWNPLQKFIQPGNTVLIKPNLVIDRNTAVNDPIKAMECTITHPAVVRCIFDYVYIALRGKGRIIIADAPIQGCDFDSLLSNTGYGVLFEFVKQKALDELKIITGDLRNTVFKRNEKHMTQSNNPKCLFPGVEVDLGMQSYFSNYSNLKGLRVTDYDGKETTKHHSSGKNEYCISSCVLEADVIINVPKPKTHRIAGYTGAMKNMIGMNARKEYLPHHSRSFIIKNGDDSTKTHILLKNINSTANDIRNWSLNHNYINLAKQADNIARIAGRKLNKLEPDRKRFGMWYGNDTIWRTILDLNHIVMYVDKGRNMQKELQRKILHIGDLVVSGEGEGPLSPSYKHIGGIMISDNAVEFDYCLVKLMGFDYRCFPVLMHALSDCELFSDDGEIILNSNDKRFDKLVNEINDTFSYIPSSGWSNLLKLSDN